MRKIFKWSLIATVLVAITTTSLWLVNNSGHGESYASYFRFTKIEKGKRVFNWHGLHSMWQLEARRTVTDSAEFTQRVIYPVASKFRLVTPKDTAELEVAHKIASAITDTINRIRYNLAWEYDGQMMAVRNAVNPSVGTLPKPYIVSMFTGTASPEAVKYGFEQSVQPKHFEKENDALARDRLNRTVHLVGALLRAKGIESFQPKVASYELQLEPHQVKRVLQNHALLDSMRYVEAHNSIKMQKVVVTPFTFPLFLLVLFGLGWLATFLSLKRKTIEPVHVTEETHHPVREIPHITPTNRSFGWWLELVLMILIVVTAICIFMYRILQLISIAVIILILLLCIGFVCFLIYKDTCISRYRRFHDWWSRRHWKCKVVLAWFFVTAPLIIVFLIALATGYIRFC